MHTAQNPKSNEPVSDDEIVAYTVRYARAAQPGTRASDILEMLKQDFAGEAGVSEDRIRFCMTKAAVLLEKQHER